MSTRGRRKKRTRAQAESESEFGSLDEEQSSNDDAGEDHLDAPSQKRRKSSRNCRMKEQIDDDELDNSNLTSNSVSRQEVTAMKQEIRSLQKRVKKLVKIVKSLQSNEEKTPSVSKSNGHGKKQFKAFASALQQVAKLKKTNFFGDDDGDITVESVMIFDDFDALFGVKGTKIQPTPNNKAQSVKTIIEFQDWKSVKALVCDYEVQLKRKLDVSVVAYSSCLLDAQLVVYHLLGSAGYRTPHTER